ncbi:hypothetical protein [Helicobacter sp. T3_23-1056]
MAICNCGLPRRASTARNDENADSRNLYYDASKIDCHDCDFLTKPQIDKATKSRNDNENPAIKNTILQTLFYPLL